MPITPFLKGHAFEPEMTIAMGMAFETVCAALGLSDKTDAATELVAQEIITAAETGIADPNKLASAAIRKFDASSS